MNRNKILAGLLVLAAAFLFVFIGCDLGGKGEENKTETTTVKVRAAAPFITQQPKDYTYFVGETVQDLTVVVDDPTDEGTLSYQWYSNTKLAIDGGTALTDEGAMSAAYTPVISTAAPMSPAYYYVVITNTNTELETGYQVTSVNSKVVQIRVSTTPSGEEPPYNATITVDTETKYQYVRGFGGMDVPWDNFPDVSMEDMDNMFNPDKLGFNMLRVMIMPWNIDIDKTMYDLVNNIEYPDKDRSHYYDFVKMVNGYGGYVLASPWSPPKEWKNNESTLGGGRLISSYYKQYANYLAAYCKHMYQKGAPVYAVSIQNEPNYRDEGYDGCTWEASDMMNFFKQQGYFTRGIKGYGGGKEIPRVLTMNGESANNPNINDAALNDEGARRYIDIIGRHIYGTRQTRYAKAINLGYEVWMTEHNINSNDKNLYPNDSTWNYLWKFMNDVDMSIRMNDESAFIWWSLKRFYSFIAEGHPDSATTDHDILPRGHGLSHYAKFASEMWRTKLTIEGTTGTGVDITTSNFNFVTENMDKSTPVATAFVSDDGNTISLVLFTPTSVATPATSDNGNLYPSGMNMGTIKIQLPDGFTANGAVAMRSTSGIGNQSKWEDVNLSADRNTAYVELPASNILSVKFTK
jgi:O-glycosyl hydrolase